MLPIAFENLFPRRNGYLRIRWYRRGSGGDEGGYKRPGPSYKAGKAKSKREYRVGVNKRSCTSELRIELIEQMEKEARNNDICGMFIVPESTVRSMRKQGDELKVS